ncbi:hypothetical protein O6H91_03G126600 [Diphasiastrum complanatum]|uniref:Uncharacterized protein n=1 Tax=Diphasiastrum complanatum TaxID=34168 RepID=A0ACC2EBL3_DIPCM|nr:hypothetical protein O6H91_03G126600 [Diphasiastrum complanatum]
MEEDIKIGSTHIELGDGSDVLFLPHFLESKQAWQWMRSLDQDIPWCRPSLFVFGRTCTQPRETCYVASKGLQPLKYSGFEPIVHSWDDYLPLRSILTAVHEALPGTIFNSVLLNRYTSGSDYAGWHADDEKLYGTSPTIASVSLGVEREFLIRKKKKKQFVQKKDYKTPVIKKECIEKAWSAFAVPVFQEKRNSLRSLNPGTKSKKQKIQVSGDNTAKVEKDSYSFSLKHGSLFVMRGNMQRDWEHSVPKRMKLHGLRINLTFRYVLKG